jgi:hypothetical protein
MGDLFNLPQATGETLKLSDVMYSGGDKAIAKYLKCLVDDCDAKIESKNVYDILKESFFINESINHLKYYYKHLQNEEIILKYKSNLVNINPK